MNLYTRAKNNRKERVMREQKHRLPKAKPLVECLEDMPDPRMDRTRRHKLIDILVIGLCSSLTGGDNFSSMVRFGKLRLDWLKSFLELPNGIPCRDTFNRVFSAIDPYAFLECFAQWVEGICPNLSDEVVAIDGKALRRALNAGESIPYIVSAWASDNGLVLGQVKVDEKSNEITAVPELLRVLKLDGAIVTLDAMGCQKDIAADIVDQHADYVLALKGNHSNAHDEVKSFFDDAVPPCATECAPTADKEKMDFHQTIEKGHGRIETRRYWQSTDIQWFQDKGLWKGLKSFGMVESIRNVKGQSTIERRYYLASLPLDVKRLAKAARKHWGIENCLHWSLDVTFREDDSRARTKNAAQNLATLRRITLNLLKKDQSQKCSLRLKRYTAALDQEFLGHLIGI
jgi:predicted transposase YbfD/YdcC